jgi:phage tail sheath gpL-like
MVYFVRYMRQRITQKYGRHALADDNPTGNPGIVTAKILKAECIHVYNELENGGLVENSDLFAQVAGGRTLERSEPRQRLSAGRRGQSVPRLRRERDDLPAIPA